MAYDSSAGLESDELALDCREGGGGGVVIVSSAGLKPALDCRRSVGGGGGGVAFDSSAGLKLALDCRGSGGGGGGGGVAFDSSAGQQCDCELLGLDGSLDRRGGGGGGGGKNLNGFLDGLVMVLAASTLFFSLCFNSSLGSSIGVDQLLCVIPSAVLGFIGVLMSSGGIGSLGNISVTGFASSFASKLSMPLSVVVASLS